MGDAGLMIDIEEPDREIIEIRNDRQENKQWKRPPRLRCI